MAERKVHGLQRVLGTSALFSTAYGNVGSSIYYALGLVVVFALGMTPVIFVIAGFFFYMTAATYAEATAMFPEAGGSSSFARHAFNEFWSFFAAWGQMLNYIITVAISAFFVPHYLGVFWEPLRGGPWDIIGGCIIVAILGALNVFGIKESAGVNIFLAVTDFLTQLVLMIVGVVLVLNPDILVQNIHFGTAPTVSNFLIAIPVGMVAYTGIETISNMAEEARDSDRTVPRSIKLVVVAVYVIYAGIPAVALSALPVTCDAAGNCTTLLATEFAGDPILGIVKNLGFAPGLQTGAEIYVGILAATILFIATNAGIIGVSRLTYSMGQHRQLPEVMRRLHPRFRTPYLAIAIFCGVACLAMVPGQADFLGTIYSFGAMLSFSIAHASVIRMRVTMPDRKRPYRGPGEIPFRGQRLPLFALIGGFGTVGAFITVTVLNLTTAAAGCAWMAIGLTTYVVYRRHIGLNLTETHKIESPKPVVEHEMELESVLVAFEDLRYSTHAIATAVKLAARRKRGVHVLCTITVPLNLPPTARLREQEERANSIIEAAKLIGGNQVTGHWEKVRRGGAAGRIVAEAKEMQATAIVMPLPPRGRVGGSRFGDTLEAVLEDRPCRVIIDSAARGDGATPAHSAAAGARA